MYEQLLDSIAEQVRAYGQSLQPPCPRSSLAALRNRVQDELCVPLPEEFVRFLKKTDGLDWNGLSIFGSTRSPIVGYTDRYIEGLVEQNLSFRDLEPMSDFLVFGSDGVALYALCISAETYQVLTTVGLTVLEAFPNFDELLWNALDAHR